MPPAYPDDELGQGGNIPADQGQVLNLPHVDGSGNGVGLGLEDRNLLRTDHHLLAHGAYFQRGLEVRNSGRRNRDRLKHIGLEPGLGNRQSVVSSGQPRECVRSGRPGCASSGYVGGKILKNDVGSLQAWRRLGSETEMEILPWVICALLDTTPNPIRMHRLHNALGSRRREKL